MRVQDGASVPVFPRLVAGAHAVMPVMAKLSSSNVNDTEDVPNSKLRHAGSTTERKVMKGIHFNLEISIELESAQYRCLNDFKI